VASCCSPMRARVLARRYRFLMTLDRWIATHAGSVPRSSHRSQGRLVPEDALGRQSDRERHPVLRNECDRASVIARGDPVRGGAVVRPRRPASSPVADAIARRGVGVEAKQSSRWPPRPDRVPHLKLRGGSDHAKTGTSACRTKSATGRGGGQSAARPVVHSLRRGDSTRDE
jgi:hypothetical protein